MDATNTNTAGWKQKARRELIAYWSTFAYLAVFFGAFYTYRRLILSQYNILYLDYGVSLVKALILSKLILIGDVLHFGRGREGRPLIFTTLSNAVIFTLWAGVFTVLEKSITGWFGTGTIAAGWAEIRGEGLEVLLAQSLMVFVALLPFFAIKELGRALGEEKIRALFIHGRPVPASNPEAR